jgi:AbrB family looped-hinge helix DNA binding protein
MKLTVDTFGRLVIPKKIREKLGFNTGAEIEIEERDYELVLRQAEPGNPLKLVDSVLVFSGTPSARLDDAVKAHRETRLKETGGLRKK